MINIEQVNINDKIQVNQFIQFHYDLYKGTPQWVPPFYSDIQLMLNKNKHPFYELNDADFFTATDNGKVIGRVAVMENKSYNKYHGTKKGQFYLFDCIDDQEIAKGLFNRVFEWCKKRDLMELVGPKGFSAFDGYGVLVEGYEHRQMMNMMNYNFPYYMRLIENLGFEKEVDFVSCYLKSENYILPEKVREVARRVKERGTFQVSNFRTKNDLRRWAQKIGQAYNNTFVYNWEYYPFTQREIEFIRDNLLTIAVPSLIKIITHHEDVVGFLLGFPDVSAAMQRHNGKVSLSRPGAILDIMKEMKRTNWVALNGAGVSPEFQGRGGNALLYYEMERTLHSFNFENAELTQVAETTKQMRRDLMTSGAQPYKNHRVYHRKV
jgi:GNAT superfamily N-acetyltransferase